MENKIYNLKDMLSFGIISNSNTGTLKVCVMFMVLFIMGINTKTIGQPYYVDPNGNDNNPGTLAEPWQTIQKAANTLTAGDTVYIRAGTYPEQVIPQIAGSAGNYITYAAYPGETVTIDGAGISLPNWETGLFVLEDISYIKVSGLRIINAGPNDNNAGIYVDNSHYIIIENNYTYNTVSSGIGVWDCSNVIIDGNEIRLACNDGEQEVITVSGTDTFEIKNNHVHDGGPGTNGGEGITIKGGATNGKIYQNHVHDITRGERTCIYIDAWGTNATSNIEVYRNTLHNCGAGISLASEDGGLVRNVKIYNNIVYDNQSNGLEIGNWGEPGILVRPIASITFINNTVYNNGSAGWGGGFFNENSDVTDIVVRNNIFSQNPTSQIVNESTASLTVDHNLIDGSQEYAYAISGTDYVVGDPLFAEAAGANFHLQLNSPAIDKGSSINAPVNDFDGNPRLSGQGYDIGAYEYQSAVGVFDNGRKSSTPKTLVLLQNYPNPFNPTTTIQYDLPIMSNIELIIYNMLGQKVRILVNEIQNAGSKSIVWNGTDNFDKIVNSGIYFYTLFIGNEKQTRKMLFIR